MGWTLRVSLVAAVLVIAGAAPGIALGQVSHCEEEERTEPAGEGAENLLELQPNAARPTFDVELSYNTDGGDEISFTPMAGRRPGAAADVAAEFTDAPRYDGQRLKGQRHVAARPSESGRQILVEACFANVPKYAAGRWEGTISVYGPRLSDFTYAIVVTTKWPRWTALVAIATTILGSLAVALVSGGLDRPGKDWREYLRVGFALVLALALAMLPYWSVYASNETWGSTPAADITALVTASFAAAIGGFATAKRLIAGK